MADIPVGTRSDALMEVGYFCAEAGLNDTEIYSLLQDADSRWEKYVHRRDRHQRLADIIERARRKHPYGTDNIEFNGLFGDTAPEVAPKLVFNWGEFLNTDVKIEWQLEGLLSRMGHLLLVGDPGVGKTQIGIRLAHSLVFGRNWLNWKNIVGPQKVLMLSLEMNHPSLLYFCEIIASDLAFDEQAMLKDRFFIAPIGEDIPVEKESGRAFIDTLMDEVKPDCVIIDSFGKLTDQALKEEEVAKGLDKYLATFRKRYSVSTVVIHHDIKTGAGKDLNSVYGSRYVTAYADTVLGFSKLDPSDRDSPISVDCRKARLSRAFDTFMLSRTPTLDFVITEPEDLARANKSDRLLSKAFRGWSEDDSRQNLG